MMKPPRLYEGATLAVIAPSSGVAGIFPHVRDKGVERLQEMGFSVKLYPTAKMGPEEVYQHPEYRVQDIHDAFKDPEVDGIVSTIGGEDSVRVLPYLDTQLIKDNPKFFMGFSDVSTYTTYLHWKTGLVTFNGPSVMAGFAESGSLETDFKEAVSDFLMTDWETFTYRPFARYTHGYPDWSDPQNIEQRNPNYRDNTKGWRMIQGSSTIEGRLYGGCIEVLEFMKGTDFWPPVDTFDEKLLFLETSEEKPTPLQVSWMLRNYGMQGVLDRINGILFGRCRDYTNEEEKDLEGVIRKILHEFGKDDLPVVMGMDFGHTDPQFILPLGTKVHINAERQEMKIQESPFS